MAARPSTSLPCRGSHLVQIAALLLVSLAGGRAAALPADQYTADTFSQPGATNTSIRGVDASGRVLAYWSLYTQPFPLPIGTPPDDEGYVVFENGVATPFSILGLSDPNIHRMGIDGTMWGSSGEGAFLYRGGAVELVQDTTTDVTIVSGVDAAGRAYGILGNYPPGTDPDANIVPIDFVSNFVWEAGAFAEPSLLLDGAHIQGVLPGGEFWGSNDQVSFLQAGDDLTILDHPGFDFTGLFQVTTQGEAYGFGLTIGEGVFESSHFFWDEANGFQEWPDDAVLPGTALRPDDMNEAGVFWGIASDNTAFVATPVPEPRTALLLGLGLTLIVRSRRRSPVEAR